MGKHPGQGDLGQYFAAFRLLEKNRAVDFGLGRLGDADPLDTLRAYGFRRKVERS